MTPLQKLLARVREQILDLRTPAGHRAAERMRLDPQASAAVLRRAVTEDDLALHGVYGVTCMRPANCDLSRYVAARDKVLSLEAERATWTGFVYDWARLYNEALVRLRAIPLFPSWSDVCVNLVTTEGKNASLTHLLKGSSYTASQALGLIEDAGYSAVAAGNTAANITAAAGGSPANGWNEAQSSTCAARQTPSYGTASGGSLAASATSHAILATDTIKGCFQVCRSSGGTAPSTTVGNTNGALLSAGLFTGGDKNVASPDTLQVTYTLSA